ncbi:homoserine dehydrogenase [Paracrocinitomix mangrovi]|uniref:homoserine dehydrogenase n=1 Tax=Paracrocinitomix mangrovi TaxID=2862509 RepID=UPI001C8DBB94|nr:homoserine dehydrogenase [Paracrocinitomix mangrovi]UKN02196.1 homoserine dehydrogenase [Paracrocinitomix mangrovi]
MRKELKIGLFGFGCVGSGLYDVLNKSKLLNASIDKIVVKDPLKQRSLPEDQFYYDPNVILDDPEINVVVELIDDADAAFDIVTKAFKKGKHVVSANKKMIAEHLIELLTLKDEYGVSFLYEASSCASIPVIRNLEEYYNNDSLAGIEGICNGTTNYILTRLQNELKSFDEILKDAQDVGFAESDPTLDIDGFDSKYKLQILILHTFGLITQPEEVLNLGIRYIKQRDIQYAKEKGLRIKLVSFARRIDDKIVAYVAPQIVDDQNFAFEINYEFNGVSIEALFSDKQVFIGKGAGSHPTASAVLSDVSALQFDYKYEYKKFDECKAQMAKDAIVKVFVSTEQVDLLEKVDFIEVEEEFVAVDYAYKVGRLKLSQLSHTFYRENPELFISFYGDNDIELLSLREEFKESVTV